MSVRLRHLAAIAAALALLTPPATALAAAPAAAVFLSIDQIAALSSRTLAPGSQVIFKALRALSACQK